MIWLTILVTILLVVFYVIRKRQMTILKRNGINGPEPHLIFGNIFSHFTGSNVEKYESYLKKYGKTCGYYVGKRPNILTIDVELIKRFQIKDFDRFPDRNKFGFKNGIRPNPRFSSHIIENNGAKWKETRSILNPTFSALKLKKMTPIIESSIDIMINKVDQQAKKGTEFNIYDYFQLLTTDVISKTAFGIDTNVQHDPENEFFKAAKKVFDTPSNKALLMIFCFPELDFIFYPFRRLAEMIREFRGKSPTLTLAKMIEAALRIREKNPIKNNDLLQLMLDANVNEEDLKNSNASNLSIELSNEEAISPVANGITANGDVGSKKVKSLTRDEVITNAIIFYEAGYETTSTALGFIAHFLVTRPDIQEKVRQEVIELYNRDGKFDYNTVSQLPYMQCVINESIRFYPPVTSFINRSVDEDYPYNGIVIPKNSTIKIPTYSLHHCAEYWPNPEVFDPERFRDRKNYNPNAFQAFGNGPRNCIGMRFALYEMKLALAKLLHRYRLEPGPSTEQELTIEHKIITETPKYGVFVKAIPI